MSTEIGVWRDAACRGEWDVAGKWVAIESVVGHTLSRVSRMGSGCYEQQLPGQELESIAVSEECRNAGGLGAQSAGGAVSGLCVCDLGAGVRYADAFALQQRLVARRVAGAIDDTLLLLEHHPVYTLGRNADARNILMSSEALESAGFDVCETSRGGDVTYHGPGQLVVYSILDLGSSAREVVGYVSRLEQVIITLLAGFGIEAGTDRRNRGVWVGDEKIAALGIRVARGVTMHGFALNVSPELAHFGGIVPCGIQDAGVTSMVECLGGAVEMAEVKRRCVSCFCELFSPGDVRHIPPEELERECTCG